jgi:hypothetical protein
MVRRKNVARTIGAENEFADSMAISNKEENVQEKVEICNAKPVILSSVQPKNDMENSSEPDRIDSMDLISARDNKIALLEKAKINFERDVREALNDEIDEYYETLSENERDTLIKLGVTIADTRAIRGFGTFITAGFESLKLIPEKYIDDLSFSAYTFSLNDKDYVHDNGKISSLLAEDYQAIELQVSTALESIYDHNQEIDSQIAKARAEYSEAAKNNDYARFGDIRLTRSSNYLETTDYKLDETKITNLESVSFTADRVDDPEVEVIIERFVSRYLKDRPELLWAYADNAVINKGSRQFDATELDIGTEIRVYKDPKALLSEDFITIVWNNKHAFFARQLALGIKTYKHLVFDNKRTVIGTDGKRYEQNNGFQGIEYDQIKDLTQFQARSIDVPIVYYASVQPSYTTCRYDNAIQQSREAFHRYQGERANPYAHMARELKTDEMSQSQLNAKKAIFGIKVNVNEADVNEVDEIVVRATSQTTDDPIAKMRSQGFTEDEIELLTR